MIEDHGYSDSCARTVRWNQNLLPSQCNCKIVYLESYMGNSLDCLGIRRIWVKSHPFNAKWTGLKTRNVNVEAGHVNLIRVRNLSGNSNVVITPAIPRNCSWGFVVLSQMLMQNRDLLFGSEAVRLYASLPPLIFRVEAYSAARIGSSKNRPNINYTQNPVPRLGCYD